MALTKVFCHRDCSVFFADFLVNGFSCVFLVLIGSQLSIVGIVRADIPAKVATSLIFRCKLALCVIIVISEIPMGICVNETAIADCVFDFMNAAYH